MTTVPITAVRQALDDTEAALARLRPALGAAYGIAGENLSRAAGQLDVAERRAESAKEDAETHRANHQAACRTIAEMHEAATGRTGMGPIRGVVEDVADVRARAEQAEADMKEIARAYERHRRSLAAIFARSAETSFEEITEYAAKTLTRNGKRLLDAEERLAAAEQFAIRLAAAENARAEAERVADRATNTLLRIKHARTAADAWTELGTYYHLSATEAGRRARDWRSTADRDATTRAEQAEAALSRVHRDAVRTLAAWRSARRRARAHLAEQQRVRGWLTHWADRARAAESDAERFHAAWHSARLRAQRTASELRVAQASRRRWKRRTKTAEQLLANVRQYLAAVYADDIDPGVSDDLALILDGHPAQYAPLESQ